VEADVIVVGFGAAGMAAAVTAHELGAKVLILEKAPEGQEGGNTRVAGQGYLNTSSVEKGIAYLTALCGHFRVPEVMVRVWAEEMCRNNDWLAGLGCDPQEHQHQPGYALVVAGFGSAEEHAEVLDRIRGALQPLVEFATPMPYVAIQQLFDEAHAWGFHCYEKSTYLDEITDEAIEEITAQVPRRSSPLSVVLVYRLAGAYCEVGEDDTAFGGRRTPGYSMFIVGVCPTPELLVADRAWARSCWEAMRPHSPGIGAYVNGICEQDDDRVRASYGPTKFERLGRIKASYDPGNVFHRNLNIKPG